MTDVTVLSCNGSVTRLFDPYYIALSISLPERDLLLPRHPTKNARAFVSRLLLYTRTGRRKSSRFSCDVIYSIHVTFPVCGIFCTLRVLGVLLLVPRHLDWGAYELLLDGGGTVLGA